MVTEFQSMCECSKLEGISTSSLVSGGIFVLRINPFFLIYGEDPTMICSSDAPKATASLRNFKILKYSSILNLSSILSISFPLFFDNKKNPVS